MTQDMNINRFLTKNILSIFLLFLMLGIGVNEAWGQENSAPTPKVANGIYYIKHNTNGTWYLWRSVVTNSSTGQNYLTTFNGTSAPKVNGKYEAHGSEYCHWIVKNVKVGDNYYIQLINAKTGEYVIRRNKTPGDRDVWLDVLPTGANVSYSYFNLVNDNSPYRISYPDEDKTYSFNSANGDKLGIGCGTNGTDLQEARRGLLQLSNGGTPIWTFTTHKYDAPTINFNAIEGFSYLSFSD